MGSISRYPEFVPVDTQLKDAVDTFTANYPPYSDFSYTNLVAWDVDNSWRISMLNDNLVVKMSDYVTGAVFYSFLGNREVEDTTLELLRAADADTTALKELYLVPEIGAAAMGASGLVSVVEDPSAHDYIVSLPSIAAARGKKFQIVRQAIGYFESKYGSAAELHALDIGESKTQRDIVAVFMARENLKKAGGHTNNPRNELTAMTRLFEYIDPDTLRTYGLTVRNRLAAFMILETHNAEWSTAHFCKADTRYRGIFRAFIHRIARTMSEEGAVYMNLEQDLGLAGLRTTKRSLNPAAKLKKYTVSRTASA